MIKSRPSRTAERVALRRAAHQLLDHPLIHDDPLALTILGDAQSAAMRAEPQRFDDGPGASVLRAFLAASPSFDPLRQNPRFKKLVVS